VSAGVAALNGEAVALAVEAAREASGAPRLVGLPSPHRLGVLVPERDVLGRRRWGELLQAWADGLPPEPLPSVPAYADALWAWLEARAWPEDEQNAVVHEAVHDLFAGLREEVEAAVAAEGEPGQARRAEIAHLVVTEHHDAALAREPLPGLDARFEREVARRYARAIAGQRRAALAGVTLTEVAERRLEAAAAALLARAGAAAPGPRAALVVLAGYGAGAAFPALHAAWVEGVVADRVVRRRHADVRLSPENPSAVLPFGDAGPVDAFMAGMDQEAEAELEAVLAETLAERADAAVRALADRLAPEDGQALQEELAGLVGDVLEAWGPRLADWRARERILPVLRGLAGRPPAELADFAGTLVALAARRARLAAVEPPPEGPRELLTIAR
jgi:hypothetical protein